MAIYRMAMSMTIDQVRARSKWATRRHVDTWTYLDPADRLILVEKRMGLPKGTKQVVLDEALVTDVRVEPLALVDDDECTAEGFPGHDPIEWQIWWATGHGYKPPAPLDRLGQSDVLAWLDSIEVRRIEFRYLNPVGAGRCWICDADDFHTAGCDFVTARTEGARHD